MIFQEKISKEKLSFSFKLFLKISVIYGVFLFIFKDFFSIEERKEKRLFKEVSQQKRFYDIFSIDGVLMKKFKRFLFVFFFFEVKVKEKYRLSEKKRYFKERDGSKSFKDSYKDYYKREMDLQEKDLRERDKEKFEKMKREYKEREGKKEILKYKSLSFVINFSNLFVFKFYSVEKKDKYGLKNLSDSVKREKVKKFESSYLRKENKEEKLLFLSKSSFFFVDKKVKEIFKSLSKVLDILKRFSMVILELVLLKKKLRVEELFFSSLSFFEDEDLFEDEDEEVVKEIIEGVEKNKDSEESSDFSSSCDLELDENVLNVWLLQFVLKFSLLS